MTWSRKEKIALAILPKFSSIFSLIGSGWIIIEVITSTTKRIHPYHRLILAMSIYDVLESIWNFMSTWPIPKNKANDNQIWAIGTTGTCSAQGFFLTLSVAVPIYNAFLSIYYMLVVNYNLRDKTLRRIVEPTMHIISFIWSFGTALISVTLGLINNANLWCWIAPYPNGCLDSWRYGNDGNCIRGDNYWIYRWGFYFAPLWFCIIIATICTFLVYRRVKRLDERTLRYRRPENSDFSFSEDNDDTRRLNGRRLSFKRALSIGLSSHNQQPRLELDLIREEQKDDEFLNGRDDDDDDDNNNETSNNTSRLTLLEHWKSQRSIYKEDYGRTVEVSQQAIWYMGAFYLTHVWSTTTRIIQQINNGKTYVEITLIHSWFDPFQGFLNFIVYQRPRYLKIRNAYPSMSRYEILCKTLRFSYLPTTKGRITTTPESLSVRGQETVLAANAAMAVAPIFNDSRLRRVSFIDDVSSSRQSETATDVQGNVDKQTIVEEEEFVGGSDIISEEATHEKEGGNIRIEDYEQVIDNNDKATEVKSKKNFNSKRVEL